jgi:hypothetical protein
MAALSQPKNLLRALKYYKIGRDIGPREIL